MANKNIDTKQSSCKGSFDWDFHFLTNLFFIHHHLQDGDACAETRKIWLHAKFTRKLEKQCSSEEKQHAAEFTNYERNKGFDWNEDGFVDYESAISAFISIKGGKPETEIRYCSICGIPMCAGYYLNGSYACSDSCRNKYYRQHGSKDDDEAEHEYLYDCYEPDMDKSDWMALPLADCRSYSNYVGDNYFYTEWN